MKSSVFFRVFLLMALGLTTFSCTSDDEGVYTSSNIAELEAVVINGKWGVSFYNGSGEDKTNYFEGYDFIFNSNKLLEAVIDDTSVNGTWSIKQNSNEDGIGEFTIYFPFPQQFTKLSNSWNVKTLNSSRMELMDVSGENEAEAILVFSKI